MDFRADKVKPFFLYGTGSYFRCVSLVKQYGVLAFDVIVPQSGVGHAGNVVANPECRRGCVCC